MRHVLHDGIVLSVAVIVHKVIFTVLSAAVSLGNYWYTLDYRNGRIFTDNQTKKNEYKVIFLYDNCKIFAGNFYD